MERHRPATRRQLTLGQVVAEAARRFGERAAVVAPEGWVLTYADFDRVSDAVAAGYLKRGLRAGDVVALLLPSSPDYLIAYVAAAKAGLITAGINPRLAVEQRRALLEVAAPALVVGTEELLDGVAADAPAEIVELGSSADDVLRSLRGDELPALPPNDARPVAIVFTSGTSGTPRGAVFTERHLAAIERLDVGKDAPWGTAGPMLVSTELVHIGAMTKLRWYARLGATLQLLSKWRAGDALCVISEQRMTSIGGIAPQIALLLRHPDFDAYDFSAVQTIVAGGAPSPPSLVAEARERFRAAYSIRYSSTESGGVGTGTAFDARDEEALHTVGRPRPGVEVSVRDDEGARVSDGDTGTVWLRSAAVMGGYWRAPEATSRTLVLGWLRTGDLGVIDDAGCLRLRGRAGDMYIRGGYNVHPETVEGVLLRHPAVRDVAIVPSPDPVLGELGLAVVVPVDPTAPPSLEDLRTFAADALARHELPERLELATELPRTPLHKLDRLALKRARTGQPT